MMDNSKKLTPRTDLRLKRLAYFEKSASLGNQNEQNTEGEELRKSMSRDPRVRPKSAVDQKQDTAPKVNRPLSAIGQKTGTIQSGRPQSSFSKSPRVVGRDGSRSSRNASYETLHLSGSKSSRKDNNPPRVDEIKVNSWLDSRKSLNKQNDAKQYTDTSREKGLVSHDYPTQKNDMDDAQQGKQKWIDTQPIKNSFSSFLEAQYEEDYSALALSTDVKHSNNHGFFLENDRWSTSLPLNGGFEPKHYTKRQKSKDDILKESLEEVVKERAKHSGCDEPDKDHVDKKVSAMFETLDPSNLEAILGKDRYVRLMKNFEESEDIVEGISSASGPGWLKDSSEYSQFDSVGTKRDKEDNVMFTLNTHRSDPDNGNVQNIQIEISEPYKEYNQKNFTDEKKGAPSAFDMIMQGETLSAHPAEAALVNFMTSGSKGVNNLPVVPEPVTDNLQLATHRSSPSYDLTHKSDVGKAASKEEDSRKSKKSQYNLPRRQVFEEPNVMYSVDDIYKEADRLSELEIQKNKVRGGDFEGKRINSSSRGNSSGRHNFERVGENCDENINDSSHTLKEYDKRLTKSGVFSEEELKGEPSGYADVSRMERNEDSVRNGKSYRGAKDKEFEQFRGAAGLLAKASLDTASEMTKPQFRESFGQVKEAVLTNDPDLLNNVLPSSHLTPEDHVEGIKQHIEFRKRELAQKSCEPPTNPALERYFSSVENLYVHKGGPGSVISSEGFEPVPEPDIFDETPGRGLALHVMPAKNQDSRPKSVLKSSLQNKAPPRPVSGRRSKDFAPSSSRSNKSLPSPKRNDVTRKSNQNKIPGVSFGEDDNTEVTFNRSDFEGTDGKLRIMKIRPNKDAGRFSGEQSRLLRDVLKEHDTTTNSRSYNWDEMDDDDLFTHVTSMVGGADGALTERIKKLNIDFDLLRAERTGESLVQSPNSSTRSPKHENRKGKDDVDDNYAKQGSPFNDDLGTCVETEIGTDLGTDFVNTFFQKKQELKEKHSIKEKEIRKSVINHAFPVVNESDDDFTVVTALKSDHFKPDEFNTQRKGKFSNGKKHEVLNRVIGQSLTDDEDSGSDFNVFRKSRHRKKSNSEDEDDIFNEEFELKKSVADFEEIQTTSRDAKSFFEEIDAKYKSSVKETSNDEQSQQMVKACPECGEVNKVYVTWCVECGGVLSEVKPVPFMSKKSHTPREVAEKVHRMDPRAIPSSPAQESFKIKLENSFSGPKRGDFKKSMLNGRSIEDQGNVKDSDNFEYEDMESPVRALPDPLKRALSLDLRTSTDSSAVASSGASGILGAAGGKTPEVLKSMGKSSRRKKGAHNELVRMSEKIDFVYNEAESPKKSFPRALQKELSLDISLDSDSTTVKKINNAAKEVLNHDNIVELPEKESENPHPAGRIDVSTETDRDEEVFVDDDMEEGNDPDDNGVGPSGDEADTFREFLSHLRKDPRFKPAGRARPSSATPQLSKSKTRPQSAIVSRSRPMSASVKSKVRSSLEASQYERKWATSSQNWSPTTKSGDLRASSSLGLKSTTRPISAKGGRPSSALSRSMGPGGDAGKGRGKVRPQSATTKSRLFENGDFGVVGKSAELDDDSMNTGRSALLTVTSATKSKSKGLRKRNVFDTYTRYIAMSPRIAVGEYSAWLCLPDELWLMVLEYLKHKDLSHVAQTCSHLNRIAMDDSLWKNIFLRKSHVVNDDGLINIGKREPSSLSFVQCHGDHVTSHGMRELFRQCSESLQELRFTGCNRGQLTGDNILLHAASRCRNITRLDASWTNVNDNGVTAISEACDRLEAVNFSGCQTLTDEAIGGLLVKHGIYLREIELFGCFNLTVKTATALANHCKGLINLNIGQLWKLTDTSIAQLSGSLGLIETLNISGCKQMKDTGVHRIVQNCPKLKSLALANCPTITDTSMGEVATYCSQVRSLDVSGCKNVGNNGIRMLAMACQQLEFLDLSSTACTHKAVTSLANYCNRRLEVVKVNFCKNISVPSLVKLATHCRRLKKVYIYGVNGIRSVEEIKSTKPDLWIEQ